MSVFTRRLWFFAALLASCGEPPMSRNRVAGPTGALAVNDAGRGEELPVIFAHSLAGNSSHWTTQVDHLRSNRRTIALDFRGHGQSERPKNGDYSISGLAGDIGAVADSLRLERFVLVGHSLGGGVALSYAGSHPDRVAGLLLLDPIGDGKQISAAEAQPLLAGLDSNYDATIREYWNGITGPDSSVRERLLADLRATPREAVVSLFRDILQFDPDPALARYRGRILSIVTPFNDQPFSLHRLGKGFPHHVVQGTGHWIQLDKPDEVNRMMDEFLEKTKKRER
jgi:pimeloyl-ACP methyl ester carboxylesterase